MPLFTPIGGGGGIGKATVTATTGSPTIDTSSRAGKTIYKFTGSGSITVGKAGTAEILIIGGGGGGSTGKMAGGGAGGFNENTSAILPEGTLTVTIGAGGASNYTNAQGQSYNGYSSVLGPYVAVGGGAGGGIASYANQNLGIGIIGGSGGGGAMGASQNQNCTVSPGGPSVDGQGNYGGYGGTSGSNYGGGGGGGAGGSGYSYWDSRPYGGAGRSSSITGTSVVYASGGGGGNWNYPTGNGPDGGTGGGGTSSSNTSASNGTANSGGGGGATSSNNSTGIGGSGYVVVVIG